MTSSCSAGFCAVVCAGTSCTDAITERASATMYTNCRFWAMRLHFPQIPDRAFDLFGVGSFGIKLEILLQLIGSFFVLVSTHVHAAEKLMGQSQVLTTVIDG